MVPRRTRTRTAHRSASSRFLLLPPEVRHLIYHDILSLPSVVLRDFLWSAGCGRRYWHFCLDDAHTNDDIVSLLRLCKQIHNEVRPLLQHHIPSRLIFSRDLHELPDSTKDFPGLRTAQITYMAIDVKNLGENSETPRKCPRIIEPYSGLNISSCTFTNCYPLDIPPPEPNRLPNLKNIHRLSYFISKNLPALREFHIYDVLKHSLLHPEPCRCPLAGTESCTCGACECKCLSHPPLPTSKELSITEVESLLCEALLPRYQAALPKWCLSESTEPWARARSDYFCLLDLLAHGVHVFLHDEIAITAPLEDDSNKALYKARWSATFYIAPPKNAKTPADPQTGALSTREKDKEESLSLEDSLRMVTPQMLMFDRKMRDLPDGVTEQPNVSYSLRVRCVDEQSFDEVAENDSPKLEMNVNGKKALNGKSRTHWKWG